MPQTTEQTRESRRLSRRLRVCAAAAAVLLVGAVGCHDQSSAADWRFDDRDDTGGEPTEDAADAGGFDDTGVDAGDTSSAETGEDDAGDGWRRLEEDGWYLQSAERSEFVPQEAIHPKGTLRNGTCSIQLLDPGLRRERWWANWRVRPEADWLAPYPTGTTGAPPGSDFIRVPAFYEVKGRLSPEGSHGHLGQYDRTFRIAEAELKTCRSVAWVGHCAVPQSGSPNCLITGRTAHRPGDDATLDKREFVRRDLGPGGSKYRLRLGPDAADGISVTLTFTHTPGPIEEKTVAIDDALSAKLTLDGGWHPHITYEKLHGWVGRIRGTKRETLRISISGTNLDSKAESSSPERLHVWGAYTVDRIETGAAPDDD